MIVCVCNGVSDRTIKEVIREGAATVGQVAEACGAGGDCGSCCGALKQMIAKQRDEAAGRRPFMHVQPMLAPAL